MHRIPEGSPPPADAGELLPRGVYLVPFRRGGRPVLIAVDAAGECVAEQAVPEGWDTWNAMVALRRLLDELSPAAAPLTLVRSTDGRPSGRRATRRR